jgi:hypothetical protein
VVAAVSAVALAVVLVRADGSWHRDRLRDGPIARNWNTF